MLQTQVPLGAREVDEADREVVPRLVSLGHPGASPPLPQELGFLGLLIFQEKPDFGFFFF